MTMKYDLENFAPYIVSTLSRLFADLLEKSLKAEGLSLSNWRVLLCLEKYNERTLNQIVEYTLLPQSTLSRSLARMEERGLISRTRQDADGRTYDIRITGKGSKKIEKTYYAVQEACEKPLLSLDPEERELWMTTMKKIIKSIGNR